MSNLSMEKRILYSNAYCAYREYKETGVLCKHPYSFKECDLNICPIVQERYANIIFQPDGIYLFVKEPSEDSIAGRWNKYKIELDLDNPREAINFVKEKASGINEYNMERLLERLNNIIERYKFLKEKGKSVPVISGEESLLEDIIKEEETGAETIEELETLEESQENKEENELDDLELLELDDE